METLINDYLGNDGGSEDSEVKEAIPKIYEYRERFKKRQLNPSDVTAVPKMPRIGDDNSEFDRIDGIVGRKTFFGPGTEIDI